MMEQKISDKMLQKFEATLKEEEKSKHTVEKYIRDVRQFRHFTKEARITKALMIEYKAFLAQEYAVSSANSMIAAVNSFLRFAGWTDCCVKQFRVQKKAFCSEERELTKAEYLRLVCAAANKGNERLKLIIQTLCGTGIRVSELSFITVEAVRKGEAVVSCKSKTRTVFIVRELQKKLSNYVREMAISSGSIFVTKSGKPISRCNIWREMKQLCEEAGVSPDKVFPHNLRHLFARTFYGMEKDIAKLADLLGHSSINTTRIYIVSTGSEHRRRMENMRLIL